MTGLTHSRTSPPVNSDAEDYPELNHEDQRVLYLAYAYRFPRQQTADGETPDFDLGQLHKKIAQDPHRAGVWSDEYDDNVADELLPHIEQHILVGQTARVVEIGANFEGWLKELKGKEINLVDASGKNLVCVKFAKKGPWLYLLESGIVFVVFGMQPVTPTWKAFLEAQYAIVRRGAHYISPAAIPANWLALVSLGHAGKPLLAGGPERITLRSCFAALVPGVPTAPPPGAREQPLSFSVVATKSAPGEVQLYRLRLGQKADQARTPAVTVELGRTLVFEPSASEKWLFSPLSTCWVLSGIKNEDIAAKTAPVTSYLFSWLIVQHQRLFLLELSTRCASLAKSLLRGRDPEQQYREFADLELERLWYFALFDFSHLSHEERREQFYRAQRSALDVAGLFDEVRQEVTQLLEVLSERRERDAALRAEALNEAVAFLALVLTPLGIVVGVFQRETFPVNMASGREWLVHGPFWAAVVVTCVCVAFLLWFRRRTRRKRNVKR